MSPRGVLIYADLALASIRQGRDRQLLLWMTLRALDREGVGWNTPAQVRTAARRLNWSTRLTRKVLRGGERVFWVRSGGRVYQKCPTKVALALGVGVLRGAFRVPVETLSASLRTVRARLRMLAIAAIRRGRPTSNAVMAAMLGVSRRTVQRWRRRAGVPSRQNWRVIAPLGEDQVATYGRLTGEKGLAAIKYHRRFCLAQRMPDSLEDVGAKGVRRHLRRANGRLRTSATTSVKGAGGNVTLYAPTTRRAGVEPRPSHYTNIGWGHNVSGDQVALWTKDARSVGATVFRRVRPLLSETALDPQTPEKSTTEGKGSGLASHPGKAP